MSELKTLKDCNLIYGAYQQGNRMLNMVDYDELKAEAVKICKILKQEKGKIQFGNQGFSWDKKDTGNWFGSAYCSVILNFIMWQNNLTEEDLE